MIQCEGCEFFTKEPNGRITLRCNPFATIKEPECLQKWQLLHLQSLVQGYQTTLNWYRKIAPMQEKMIDFMKREMNDIDEADSWKYDDEPDNFENPEEDPDDKYFG